MTLSSFIDYVNFNFILFYIDLRMVLSIYHKRFIYLGLVMKYIIFFSLLMLVTACAPNVEISSEQPGQKQTIGTLSGMIIGGALANDMAG